MDVLVVGSLAYDSLETPFGKREDELGGSASYGGFSASFHDSINNGNGIAIVGVVGNDFKQEHIRWYKDANLDISGLEIKQGLTFRWKGSYHGDMSQAVTHDTQLNVFETFNPVVPKTHCKPKILMCANLLPSIQASIIEQTQPSRLTILDSMNLWIEISRDDLLNVIKKVEILILNDAEVKMLAGDENLITASKKVLELSDGGILVVKKGEHGVIAFHPDGIISIPSFPVENLRDPTGCGDSFAGAMAQRLSGGEGELTLHELSESLVHATVTASFTLEEFGTARLRELTRAQYQQRLEAYRMMSRTS